MRSSICLLIRSYYAGATEAKQVSGEARGGADGVCVRRATTYRCRADLLDLDVVQRAGINRPHLQMPAAATEESQQRDGVAHATGAGATATR